MILKESYFLKYGLNLPALPIFQHNFLEKPDSFDWVASNECVDGIEIDEEMETSGGTISEDDERDEKPRQANSTINSDSWIVKLKPGNPYFWLILYQKAQSADTAAAAAE